MTNDRTTMARYIEERQEAKIQTTDILIACIGGNIELCSTRIKAIRD